MEDEKIEVENVSLELHLALTLLREQGEEAAQKYADSLSVEKLNSMQQEVEGVVENHRNPVAYRMSEAWRRIKEYL